MVDTFVVFVVSVESFSSLNIVLTVAFRLRYEVLLSYFRIFLFFFFLFGTGFLSSSGCPGTYSVDQAGLRDPPASAPQVLELKAYTTVPGHRQTLKRNSCRIYSW